MSKTRHVVRLPHAVVVIDTSVCEENCNFSLSDWVKRVRSYDDSVQRTYKFKWCPGDNINVDRCELRGRFSCDDQGRMSVHLCLSCYPVFYCTMEEFMKLFRIGNSGWCISSVVNVL